MHPEIEGATESRKELHYFDRFFDQAFGPADINAYHAEFGPPGGNLRGEWSPRYMYDFWTARLLAEAAPRASLIVMLRDPVERYRSGVAHERDMFGHALPWGKAIASSALARSRYHEQLMRLLDYFPRSQLHVLQYEQCVADPAHAYRQTLDFLGRAPFDPGETQMRKIVGGVTQRGTLPGHVRQAVVRELRGDVDRLSLEFPEIDTRLWPDFVKSET
jgi:Sulfotransferase family